MYKVSIITVNYNDAIGLQKTLESIHKAIQNIKVELILIDGGSNDGSIDIIKSFESIITYSVSERDHGVYDAMNKGIIKSTGDYILFLNSGDHFYDHKSLKEAFPYLKDPDIVAFDIEMVGVKKKIKQHPDTMTFSYLFQNTLAHQSVFIKRTLFHEVGFYDTSLKITADWKFFIKALVNHNCSYKAVHRVLSSYYMGGMSSTPQGLQQGSEERIKVLKEDFKLFYEDYKELAFMNIPRFKLLKKLEHTNLRRKLTSLWLRLLTSFK